MRFLGSTVNGLISILPRCALLEKLCMIIIDNIYCIFTMCQVCSKNITGVDSFNIHNSQMQKQSIPCHICQFLKIDTLEAQLLFYPVFLEQDSYPTKQPYDEYNYYGLENSAHSMSISKPKLFWLLCSYDDTLHIPLL